MSESKTALLGKNPKIDQKVVSKAGELEKTLPRPDRPKQGADYKLSPPLGGSSRALARRSRGI